MKNGTTYTLLRNKTILNCQHTDLVQVLAEEPELGTCCMHNHNIHHSKSIYTVGHHSPTVSFHLPWHLILDLWLLILSLHFVTVDPTYSTEHTSLTCDKAE